MTDDATRMMADEIAALREFASRMISTPLRPSSSTASFFAGRLPPLPVEIPIPDDARIVGSLAHNKQTVIVLDTQWPPDHVYGYYRESLPKADWQRVEHDTEWEADSRFCAWIIRRTRTSHRSTISSSKYMHTRPMHDNTIRLPVSGSRPTATRRVPCSVCDSIGKSGRSSRSFRSWSRRMARRRCRGVEIGVETRRSLPGRFVPASRYQQFSITTWLN